MIRLISLVVFVVGLSTSLIAQIYIPPVFGKDSLDTRSDELSRLYIPPKRIMWVSHDSLVQNKEVLLLSGNGQPELGKRNMCSMYTCGQDTASILLDYGRELHGGLKLVLGRLGPGELNWSVSVSVSQSVRLAASMMAADAEKDILPMTMRCVISR